MKRAILIAIGSELLHFGREDTNTAWIAARLDELGVDVLCRTTVADEIDIVAATLRAAMDSADLVVTTGGLGPTEDDRTRDAVADAVGLPLVRDPLKELELQRRFEEYGVTWSDLQARQADLPEGAAWIENHLGSADGWRLEHAGTTLVALPGVPAEMVAMVEAGLGDWVGETAQRATTVTLRAAGLGEGSLEGLLRDLYEDQEVDVTTLGAADAVEVRLRSSDPMRLEAMRAAIAERLGEHLFEQGERRLVEVVGSMLEARGETFAAAESCTGGMLAAEATSVPGSSAWFRGAWVVYHDDLKQRWAGVDPHVLAADGAVSESVARRLAEAVRRDTGATWGVGITGIAGPGGGSDAKPVGLVHVALAGPGDTLHWKTRQPGDRSRIQRRTVAFALDRLRRAMAGTDG